MNCAVCKNEMGMGRTKWHYVCKKCKHESAHFTDKINDASENLNLDEGLRHEALEAIRKENFQEIVDKFDQIGFKPKNGSGLDVGCAHGWFMQSLKDSGFKNVVGIEPDDRIYEKFHKDVLNGYFPDVLKPKDKFDLISFNDVFEHIPDSNKVLQDVNKHLNKSGILVLNLPSSKGILYRISKLLHRMTFPSAFRRLWQKGLPSPHVHYYNPRNLKTIVESHGFKQVYSGNLKSVSRSGLKERVGYDASKSSLLAKFKNKILYYTIYIGIPIINSGPSDIQLAIFKKT